jgi:hypothetical protein
MMATNPQSNYFGIGLGGMIRRPHVRELLKKWATNCKKRKSWALAQKLTHRKYPLSQQHSMHKKTRKNELLNRLRKEDVSTLSHRDAKPWLLKIRVGAGNTKEKRIKALEASKITPTSQN